MEQKQESGVVDYSAARGASRKRRKHEPQPEIAGILKRLDVLERALHGEISKPVRSHKKKER